MTRAKRPVLPTNSPTHYPSSGSELMLGSMLGQMIAGQHSTNVLLVGLTDHVESLVEQIEKMPDRIAEKIAKPTQETRPSSPPGKVIETMKALKDLIWSLLPLAMLASVMAGKVTWPQALPIIRQALGIH